MSLIPYKLPSDFPAESYTTIRRFLQRVQTDDPVDIARCRQCGQGLNGFVFRYQLCAEADAAFTHFVEEYGDNPPHEQYLQRANHLLVFFVAGQASIESLGYAVHAMPAVFGMKPSFKVDSVAERKAVTLEATHRLLAADFAKEPITRSLGELVENGNFARWKGLRNLLTHQAHLGETIEDPFGATSSGTRQLYSKLETPGRQKGVVVSEDLVINAYTTAALRRWLAGEVATLTRDGASFAEGVFGHLPVQPWMK